MNMHYICFLDVKIQRPQEDRLEMTKQSTTFIRRKTIKTANHREGVNPWWPQPSLKPKGQRVKKGEEKTEILSID